MDIAAGLIDPLVLPLITTMVSIGHYWTQQGESAPEGLLF
jgi:hypothetical protein